jgi:hypothetical protein
MMNIPINTKSVCRYMSTLVLDAATLPNFGQKPTFPKEASRRLQILVVFARSTSHPPSSLYTFSISTLLVHLILLSSLISLDRQDGWQEEAEPSGY